MKKLPTITTYAGKNIESLTREELVDALKDAALEIESLRDLLKTGKVIMGYLQAQQPESFAKKAKP